MKPKRMKRVSRPRRNPMTARPGGQGKTTFSFDGTSLNGILFFDTAVTASNIGADITEAGVDTNIGASRAFTAMVKQYREYRYTKMVITYIPKTSPGVADAGSQIVMAYTDAPELISTMQNVATTNTARRNLAIGARNNIEFNAWERVTWNVPLSRRLPWFNVNTAMTSITAVDEIERSIQGLVVMGYSSVSAAVVLGTFRVTYHLELRGLNTDAASAV